MASKNLSLSLLLFFFFFLPTLSPPLGSWTLLRPSIGISAMHMQLLPTGHVIIFDRTDFGPSLLPPPRVSHSVLLSLSSLSLRPLTLLSDVFCSSAALSPCGTLIQTGGYLAGDRKIRLFSPCPDSAAAACDWSELRQSLAVRRWYATTQLLPDRHVIVLGGRKQFNFEFFPKLNNSGKSIFNLPFLKSTSDFFEENNLYPFVHLLPNGNLFIFANRNSIQFNYKLKKVVREYPIIPGEKRNYPSSGSSVLLPLRGSTRPDPEVMVCGGASDGAFYKANNLSVYVAASDTCGRMRVMGDDPVWEMERMPMNRVMGDMILLPSGDVLIINGASNGTAGWEDADGAVLNPVLYDPPEKRFTVLNPTVIPRMYHSSAILLPDGKILVGGSNPHKNYNFTADKYPTELSLETFHPPYLAPTYAHLRPSILTVETENKILSYGQNFSLAFTVPFHLFDQGLTVSLIAPPFTTHAFGMNQRLIFLDLIGGIQRLSLYGYRVTLRAPSTANITPPGYYMMFLVHVGVPSESVWVKVDN